MANTIKGTLNQLKNVGPQDLDLSRDPQATLFKYNVKRVPNHASHTAHLNFIEDVSFGKTLHVDIPAFGDLMHKTYLYFKLPALPIAAGSTFTGWTNSVGAAMIDEIEFMVGSAVIASISGLWIEALQVLQEPAHKRVGLDNMMARYNTHRVLPVDAQGSRDIWIPLPFWFTQKENQAFPLFLLNKHTVSLRVKLKPFNQLITYDGNAPPPDMVILDSGLVVDYLMLDEYDKEQLIMQPSVSYLIEQYQYHIFKELETSTAPKVERIDLDLFNCIKEIIWVCIETESEANNDWFNFGRRNPAVRGSELFGRASLLLDGLTRVDRLPESYFRMVTSHKHHTAVSDRNIYSISFARKPEANQPTGVINASRYDSIDLLLETVSPLPQCKCYVLGIAYNEMIITNGELAIKYLR